MDTTGFAYQVYTVSRFGIVGQTTAYGDSALEVAERFVAKGYVKVETAPAVPVNGYPEGLPVKHGDTASIDTRKQA